MSTQDNGTIRKFETGATRDTATNKNDYEGFLSPLVLEAFGDYMTENRKQSDGSVRDSDNWQKGIPQAVYMKSAFRHFMQWWKLHRGLACKDEKGKPVDLNHAICGLLFNVMGYLHEQLKPKLIIEACPVRIERPVDVVYPRYFVQENPDTCNTVFVVASETVGRGFRVWHDREDDSWGCANWSIREMLDGRWHLNPREITADEAIKFGLPSLTVKWPLDLRQAWGARTVEIGTRQYCKNPMHL